MAEKVSMRMLGGFSVAVDDNEVIGTAGKVNKPWQLLCYLALHDGAVVPSEELLRVLWETEELADPANVLKNTVYGLRRELSGKVKPQNSPVLFRTGGYCLNPDIPFETDVKTFLALCDAAEKTDIHTPQGMQAYRAATQAYRGDLLPVLDAEPWVVAHARRLKLRYIAVVQVYCSGLDAAQEWQEMLDVSQRATLVSPLDEPCLLYTFRALSNLQMHRAIVTTYSKTARYFEDEIGQPLCEEIRRIYSAAAQKVNKSEQDLLVIREDLQEVAQRQRPVKGAYYCSYDVFKHMYQLIVRAAERNKQQLALMLVSLQDARGRVPGATVLTQSMEDAYLSIAVSLRKSDTFARYSKHQYIMLLPIEQVSNLTSIEQRISDNFAQTFHKDRVKLEFRACTLD